MAWPETFKSSKYYFSSSPFRVCSLRFVRILTMLQHCRNKQNTTELIFFPKMKCFVGTDAIGHTLLQERFEVDFYLGKSNHGSMLLL